MGSYTEDDAIQLVWRLLRDTGDTAVEQLMTNTEISDLVTAATKRYSRVRPTIKVEDVVADGTGYLDLPAAFDPDFSRLVAVESPPGETPPRFKDERSFRLYQSPTEWQLLWTDGFPNSGDTVRLSYTIPRVFDAVAANTTVADADFEAVCALATSYASLAIAGKYARTSEPIIAADNINYRSKSQEWTTLSDKWLKVYEKHASSIVQPGSTWVNWDSRLSMGFDHLTHPRAGR